MQRRRGLQAEVLASLALVMLTATVVLGALLARTHQANTERLQQLAARALREDARAPLPPTLPGVPELRWWTVDREGHARPKGAHTLRMGPELAELAREALELRKPLLRGGPPWRATRFATPGSEGVVVALLPPAASGWMLLGVLVGDIVVFTAFGATLLRGRLVRPLQRLAQASRAIASGDLAARVPAEGPRETFELGTAFNDMTEALEGRTLALEKAVAELRESNRNLRTARAGLDRAERLAAVGRLAAGVAHEVGNPMGALLAFLDLVQRDGGLSQESHGHLERALREGERVRSILRQLLDFSRPPRTECSPVDVVAMCEETGGLIRAQRRYRGIEIEVIRQDDPPAALADRNGVAQILLNLLLNAADALGDGSESPRVTMTVAPAVSRMRAADEGRTAATPGRRAFDSVRCTVADNGPGIPDEDRERIFDPFFTTKEAGEGTGLGLSNALRFAEELGGSLELGSGDQTRDARGAVFVLTLPAAVEVAKEGRARA